MKFVYVSSAVFILILAAYMSTFFGITYPQGSVFFIGLFMVPIFSYGVTQAKKYGMSAIAESFFSSSYKVYALALIVFFFANFFIGISSAKTTKSEDDNYYVRVIKNKEASYVEIPKSDFDTYGRASFRFYSGHILVFVGIGLILGFEARKKSRNQR